ncbi:60s ribosomal protein [Chrysochromulina tobinii]|uniref:60s ribosomal protein n=1 Tax=Chrysochromulina tobinii TaxID=1460289 RepID=A0A0M0JJU9_9EUKA|nr:60s ribosomal protein [Chrysochromulina tobinii]|eukprot:KOO26602.1 60s ribosomal protein [Chrysochromulina sp. CCMP291]
MPTKKEAAPAPAEAPKAEKARSRAPILPAAWYRKVKKAGMDSVNAKLGLVMKSGKALLGYKSTLKSLRNGKSKPEKGCWHEREAAGVGSRTGMKTVEVAHAQTGSNRRCTRLHLLVRALPERVCPSWPELLPDTPCLPLSLVRSAAKLILISNNCPPLRKSEIEYYAMLAKTAVHHYSGNNITLGTACGKLFRTSVLSITDTGDSDIMQAIPEQAA